MSKLTFIGSVAYLGKATVSMVSTGAHLFSEGTDALSTSCAYAQGIRDAKGVRGAVDHGAESAAVLVEKTVALSSDLFVVSDKPSSSSSSAEIK